MAIRTVIARARGYGVIYAMAYAIACLAAFGATTPAHAQIQVLSGITQQRDLSFGTVITGTTTTIAPTAAGAAMWKMHGLIAIGGGFSFTLPTTLSRVGGGATMPISFSSTSAILRANNTDPTGGIVFNPNNSKALTVSVLSDIYIWLGAAVSPPLNQKAGTYQGTVVCTVAGLL